MSDATFSDANEVEPTYDEPETTTEVETTDEPDTVNDDVEETEGEPVYASAEEAALEDSPTGSLSGGPFPVREVSDDGAILVENDNGEEVWVKYDYVNDAPVAAKSDDVESD